MRTSNASLRIHASKVRQTIAYSRSVLLRLLHHLVPRLSSLLARRLRVDLGVPRETICNFITVEAKEPLVAVQKLQETCLYFLLVTQHDSRLLGN